MDVRPAPDVYDDEPWELVVAYRVTLWERPARPAGGGRGSAEWSAFPGAPMGWEETTFELVGARDVREVSQWAEATLAAGGGPASHRGLAIQDREFVVYARGREDRWLHIAGWIPVLPPDSDLNLRRPARPS
jgi:hypothetical protein